MELSNFLRKKAALNPVKLLLPEGDDERIIKAGEKIAKEGFAKPFIIGKNISIKGVEVIDINDEKLKEKSALVWAENKKISFEKALEIVQDKINFSVGLLYSNYVDAMVSGATFATAQVLKPVLELRKLYPGIPPVSSCFFIQLNEEKEDNVLVFSDCAMNINPSSSMLAQIAKSASKVFEEILDKKAKIAMLSFSTKGSANTPETEKIKKAVEIAKTKFPDLIIDGEMQVDSALVKWIAEKKAPNSPIKGDANVLIFPDLNSGNIAYKLVERLAKAKALGPILLGLSPVVNDLSRGCSVEDIVDISAIACIQAVKLKGKI